MSFIERSSTKQRRVPPQRQDPSLFDDPKRQAYRDIQRAGKDRERMNQILQLLEKYGPMTAQEMADELDVPPNYLTGPVNKLCHKFFMIERLPEKKLYEKSGKLNWQYVRVGN